MGPTASNSNGHERDPSLLPHSDEAEQSVLGAVLKSPASIERVASFLKPEDFYWTRNRHVFGAMLALHAEGVPIDYATTVDRLQRSGLADHAGGLLYLSDLSLSTPTAAHIEHYGRIVERTATMRQLIDRGQKIAELAWRDNLDPDDAIGRAETLLAGLRNGREPTQPDRFRALRLEDLAARPPMSWVVDRLVQADTVAVLEGVDGTFKTFLALGWAHCVATGRDWHGRPVQHGRVLYLLGEGSRGMPHRARAWQIVNLGEPQTIDDLGFVVDEMPQLWKGDADAVLDSNPGPFLLIVVDTLARAMVGGNENLQQDMGMLIDGCDRLRRATGACVLVLHHLNAQGQTRGSTALPGGIHTRLRLVREGTSRNVVLSVPKQKDHEPEPPLVLTAKTVELGTVDEHGRDETSLVLDLAHGSPLMPAKPKLTPAAATAFDALLELGEVGFAKWRDTADLAKTSFHNARGDLLSIGYVEHLADGRYRVSDLGLQEGPRGSKQGHLGQMDPGIGEGPRDPSPPRRGEGPTDPMPDPCQRDLVGAARVQS